MLPIWKDKLSIEKITDRWSQEIQPPTSREELLDFFKTAWWRGEWKTDSPLTPLALLKSIYRSARERDLTTLVFVTKEDGTISEGIELAGGGLLFDVNELERPTIPVPSNDPETWTDASCAAAFELLSQTPLRKYYPDRTIQFLMMEIDYHQFVQLVAAYDLDLPNFWRPSIPKPAELQKQADISISSKSSKEDRSSPLRPEIRKRGRQPRKFEQTKEAMRRDIREGPLAVTTLDAMLEKELKQRYGVSRDTARKSRAEILSEEAMRRDIREARLTLARLREMRDEELEARYGVSCGKARDVVLSEIVEKSNHDK
jgi:hypothetical protein